MATLAKQATFKLCKYIKCQKGWRYCRAVLAANKKLRPDVVLVDGNEETHPEGSYYMNWQGNWLPAGRTAAEAQVQQREMLARQMYERTTGADFPAEEPKPLDDGTQGRRKHKENATPPNGRKKDAHGRAVLRRGWQALGRGNPLGGKSERCGIPDVWRGPPRPLEPLAGLRRGPEGHALRGLPPRARELHGPPQGRPSVGMRSVGQKGWRRGGQ